MNTEEVVREFAWSFPQRFVEKPYEIDAMRWNGTPDGAALIIDWIVSSGATARYDSGDLGVGVPPVIHIYDAYGRDLDVTCGEWVVHFEKEIVRVLTPEQFNSTWEAKV